MPTATPSRAPASYSPAQVALHWLVALLVLANWLLSGGMEAALRQRLTSDETASVAAHVHVLIGLAVLALVLARLVLRRRRSAPPPVPGLAGQLAGWMHATLYLLLLAVPVLGAVTWGAKQEWAGAPHHLLANLLLALVLLHSLAALYHHYVMRDGVMLRMTRRG